jgi:lysophospholipase L1-like esterase
MNNTLQQRQLFWMLPFIGLLTSALWLESLDKYFDARFHLSLESSLPAYAYIPSHIIAVRTRALKENFAFLNTQQPLTPATPKVAAVITPLSVSPLRQPLQTQLRPPGATRVLPYKRALNKPGEFLPSLAQQQLPPGPQRILFAGDSMMQGVAPLAIHELSKSHPDWEMYDLSRQSTGLTVKRYFDWPARIKDEIAEKNLTVVIMFLGPNDPWDIYLPGKKITFPSNDWSRHYAERVDEILAQAQEHNVRVVWVGLPSMREGRIHDGAEIQNQIFYDRANTWHMDFLSTEQLLGPLSLPFQKYISNNEGQTVKLRADDGIHFSSTGLKKITHALVSHLDHAVQL